ncbi:MAG: MOSC domain-containing protein [Pseudomonadota bacterium]
MSDVTVASLHVGAEGVMEKRACETLEMAIDGIVGDRHRGPLRECWEGDKQAEGTQRRNERQWSAISTEELDAITRDMGLSTPLLASTLGINLCLDGVPDLSRLPRGTLLSFPSGAVLMIEEYNPPCSEMGAKVAAEYASASGDSLDSNAFSQAAKFSRGVVGIVEVPGIIRVGDDVEIARERLPKWLRQ